MPRAPRRRCLALVTAIAAVTTACHATPPAHSPPSFARGGTLRVGILLADPILHWDPLNIESASYELDRCCLLRTLMSFNGTPTSGGGAIARPDLATGSPEVSNEGLTWTFHLRRGIHYAPPLQGVEITAGDFVRAMERLLTPTPPALQETIGPQLGGDAAGYFLGTVVGAQEYADGKADAITGLEAPDRYTFRVRLLRPSGDLAYRLSLPSTAPLPANPFRPNDRLGVAEGHGLDYGRFAVVSGPYMFEGAQRIDFAQPPSKQIPAFASHDLPTLVRNPSWRASTDPLRHAYVDRIELTRSPAKGFEDVSRYVEGFSQKVDDGELDVLLDQPAPSDQVARYRADPKLARRFVSEEFASVRYASINVAQPPFDDVHVRRAVNDVVNRRDLVQRWESAAHQAGVPLDHFAPDAVENDLLLGYHPYGSADGSPNVAKAMAEMRQSRYDHNHDGLCDDPACDDPLVVWRDDPPLARLAKPVVAALAEVGIHADLSLRFVFDVYQACADPAQHVAICPIGWGADYPSGSTFFAPLFSRRGMDDSNLGLTKAELQRAGYSAAATPGVDDRLAACAAAIGEAQIRCWASLDEYLTGEVVPGIPLFTDGAPWVFSARVAHFSWDQFAGAPALDQIAITG